ncbi:MAG: amino acid adenylation domain-containing protein, partial [Clostridia bacterium]|nr:amino acid adenylation domain-containing protein [Clostridia bacterium]
RTAKYFIKNADGTTTFRSGDIGYYNENGDLVYVNRRDRMVKISGQRVETQEVEACLLKVPGISEAAVKAFEDADKQTYIAAFYAEKTPVGEEKLRAVLSEKLAPYMIPRYFVKLDELPKTVNGKVSVKSLPAPSAAAFKTDYAPPETEKEKILCEAFEKVLKCGTVGVNDDFFRLGGDSLKILSLIKEADGLGLTPETVLTAKTPGEIAAACKGEKAPDYKKYGDIPAECRLSAIGEGVYLDCVATPESTAYNIAVEMKLPRGTDEARFIETVKTVASHHKSLFVTVDAPDGEPKMYYHDDFEVDVPVKNVPDLEEERRAFVRPFDLARGPLYRFELCRTVDGLVFLYDVHHIIFDGTSVDVFARQIATVYDGGNCPDEELTLFDVARSEEELVSAAKYEEDLAYYEEKFADADVDGRPVSDVVTDCGFGEREESAFIVSTEGRVSVRDVKEYAASRGVTENAVMMAAFAYAFAKFNGTESSSFAAVHNGRKSAALSETTGMFVRTMPMYFEFNEDMKVSDFVKSVGDGFYETKHRDAVPFTHLAGKFGVSTAVSYIFHGELFEGFDMEGGKLVPKLFEVGESLCDLDVMVMKTGDHYELMAHFRRNVYTEDLIRSLADIFTETARGMLTADKLSDIGLVSGSARAALDNFNRTETPYEDKKTVVELFREQAKKTPLAYCVVCGGRKYTYAETDEITDRLAGHLVSIGLGRESVVGVLIPRCEHMVLSSLGVLKAGAAYMPLDPSYPPERLNLMMRDSGAAALIYDPSLADVITDDFKGVRVTTDEVMSLPENTATLPTPGVHDLFVMLYTSGSTGIPKGVMFEHNNVMAMIHWVAKYYEVDENSVFAHYPSYGFDAHTYDLYTSLISGSVLHIITEDIRLDFLALRKYFNENGITHTTMTTQIGRQFASMSGLETLKYVTVGGEKLTPPEAKNGIVIVNAYGPTEGTVVTSAFKVDKAYRDVPIGKPVDNLKGYVVDRTGRLLPPGAVGELWISGPHVTRGYLNRPEKTAEAYGENPFTDEAGYERVYRTGDVVRFMCDGNLQFVGRRDAQVKVRGFRIELTEIEEVIRRFEGIKDATVAAFDDPAGGKFVAAYVVSDGEVDVTALEDFIRNEKPPYMVPAVTVQIDEIPLTQNGKVNKRALPLPERKTSDTTPPENATQQKIFDVIAGVIGHGSFGIDSDVYDSGLTSIGAVKLNVALAEAFDVAIRIADIKANPTVRLLEKFIAVQTPAEEYGIFDDYPITETQSGIFIECMSAPDTTMYNIPLLMKLGDGVDVEKLAEAVKATINAHPYVKTRLHTDKDGSVRAQRRDGADVTVNVVKCDELPGTAKLVQPYKLLGDDLYKVNIFDTSAGKYLYMDFHHIISDGTSEAILLRDVDRAYVG